MALTLIIALILKALWNEDVFGAFREVSFEETTDLACCPPKKYVGTAYDTYSDRLSAFQKARALCINQIFAARLKVHPTH